MGWLDKLHQDMVRSAPNPLVGQLVAQPQSGGWLAGLMQDNAQANPLLATPPSPTPPASDLEQTAETRHQILQKIHAKAGLPPPVSMADQLRKNTVDYNGYDFDKHGPYLENYLREKASEIGDNKTNFRKGLTTVHFSDGSSVAYDSGNLEGFEAKSRKDTKEERDRKRLNNKKIEYRFRNAVPFHGSESQYPVKRDNPLWGRNNA